MDWKAKLCSRKFWMALAGFVAGLVAFIKSPSGTPDAIAGLIMSFGSVVSYIIGEGMADAAGAQSMEVYVPDDSEYDPPDDEME